jgi:glycosyltransferase involved in cell wall biosynthesis
LKTGLIGSYNKHLIDSYKIEVLELEFASIDDLPGSNLRRKVLTGFKFQLINHKFDLIIVQKFPENPVFWYDFIQEVQTLIKRGGEIAVIKSTLDYAQRIQAFILQGFQKISTRKECLKMLEEQEFTVFRVSDPISDFMRQIEMKQAEDYNKSKKNRLRLSKHSADKPLVLTIIGMFHRQYLSRFEKLKTLNKYQIILVSNQVKEMIPKDIRKAFNGTIRYESLSDLKNIIQSSGADLLHVFTLPYHLPLSVLKSTKKPVITEIHDFRIFRFSPSAKYQPEIDIICEEYYLRSSQAVFYKADPFSIDFLKRKLSCDIQGHQIYTGVRGNFKKARANKSGFKPRNADRLKLIYAGGVYPQTGINSLYGGSAIWPWVEEILKQNIEFHVYPKQHIGKLEPQKYRKLWELEGKYKNFHLHGNVSQKELNRKAAGFNYGLALFFTLNCKRSAIFQSTALSGKEFFYASNGLPFIVNTENYYAAKLVKDYNMGYVITLEDLPRLEETLRRDREYEIKRQNLSRFLKDFSLSRIINEVTEVYDSLIKRQEKAFKKVIKRSWNCEK